MKYLKGIGLIVLLSLVVIACNKEEEHKTDKTSNVIIKLTDAPGDYDQVNIDLKEVILKTNSSSNKWQNLPTVQGVYDLLQLQNEIDTLIASGTIAGDVLQEVRLVLGPNNTVMEDSVIYNLSVPSGSTSGLKIKVNKHLGETVHTLIVDFDAALSIHQKGNGDYQLKPVLRVK